MNAFTRLVREAEARRLEVEAERKAAVDALGWRLRPAFSGGWLAVSAGTPVTVWAYCREAAEYWALRWSEEGEPSPDTRLAMRRPGTPLTLA